MYHYPQQKESEEGHGGVRQLIVCKGIDEIGLMLSHVHLQMKHGVRVGFKTLQTKKEERKVRWGGQEGRREKSKCGGGG